VLNKKEKQTLSKWSTSDINWFALFVETYKERQVAKSLQTLCDFKSAGNYFVFVPTRDYCHQHKGVTTVRKVPWLNGYVFIATYESASDCKKMVEMLMVNETVIFRLLSYDGTRGATAMTDEDKILFNAVLDEDFHVSAIKAEISDDNKVVIKENSLESNGGRVVKVDRRNKSVLLEMNILQKLLRYEVALEFLIPENMQRVKKHETKIHW